MDDTEREKALNRFADYGSEGCLCGPRATPAIDCPVHHAVVEFERMDDRLQAAVSVLKLIREEAGAVCPEYEVCVHPACQASYGAWALADAYLRER